MWRWTVITVLAACGSSTDLTIVLTDSDNDCATAFQSVYALSVEVIRDGGDCRLKHDCPVTTPRPNTLDNAIAALRNTGDVLVEVDPGEAQILVINGRPQNSCFPSTIVSNDPVLCGYVPLDAARDGKLVVELVADTDGSICPESQALCP